MKKLNDLFMKHKVVCIVALAVLLFIFLIAGGMASRNERIAAEEESSLSSESSDIPIEDESVVSEDNLLLAAQPELIENYGSLPDGYIWEYDGTLLSLGDSSLSAEEVVYSFLNGLRNLDISTAQKYSRGSSVISRYSDYFDSVNKDTDYRDAFMRNMYREVLKSMTVNGIENTSVFAQNKQVFSVSVNLLDLTSKDFWAADKEDIYRNLRLYNSLESDSTKADMYLYDYVLDYYKSETAKHRDLVIDLTVEKYPDLKTGWLVSIDTDIDSACSYRDGTLMVNYMKEMYASEGLDLLEALDEEGELNSSASSSSSDTPESNVSGAVE